MHDFVKNIDKTWTLFLDRDGVINKRLIDDYVKKWDEFEFLPGVLESIKKLSHVFGRLIIVTNQQGVGKGLMTENVLDEIHDKMIKEIKKAGGMIDAVYYCHKLKDAVDNCRKPGVKMFETAVSNFPDIKSEKSVMVGDSESDIEFGKNAKMFTVYIGANNKKADLNFDDLKGFSEIFNV
jgi:D-glycero-D-manno-heptose 1,7-bisphosphate phosphatase